MYFNAISRRPDPFATLRRLDGVLNDMFGNAALGNAALGQSQEGGAITSAWTPACDVFEGKDGIRIVVELPGVRPEDVRLSVENNFLTVRGEKRQRAEESTERVHRYERIYGSFERTFALPGTVDTDRIDADYDAGVLTITLPKAERARPREIRIRSGEQRAMSAGTEAGPVEMNRS